MVQAMHRFAQNPHDDASFWQPAPLLARLVAEGKNFN
jgi:3-hydroxyacyl-CoA dehydrogenase